MSVSVGSRAPVEAADTRIAIEAKRRPRAGSTVTPESGSDVERDRVLGRASILTTDDNEETSIYIALRQATRLLRALGLRLHLKAGVGKYRGLLGRHWDRWGGATATPRILGTAVAEGRRGREEGQGGRNGWLPLLLEWKPPLDQ